MIKNLSRNLKLASFALFSLFLIILLSYVSKLNFNIGSFAFSYIGLFSFLIGLVASNLAFIKYFTRRKNKYIFVGTGFLGASLLDFYFVFYRPSFGEFSEAIVSNSSMFLSFFLLLSWSAWRYKDKWTMFFQNTKPVFSFAFLSIFFLILLLLRPAMGIYPVLVNSTIYLIALILYLKKNYWTYKYFEFFFLFSLISLLLSQTLLLIFSTEPFGVVHLVSESTKFLGYTLALIGLLASSYNAFSLVESYGKKIEARLKASVEGLPLGYILLDDKGEIVVKNDILREMFGNLAGSSTGLKNLLKIEEKSKKAMEGKDSLVEEIERDKKFFKLYFTPVIMGTQPVGTVILVQDMTEQKLLDKTKDEFIALASHELRTPITTIKGNAEMIQMLIKDKGVEEKDLEDMVKDIQVSSVRLLNIAEQFLDVSSLEQEKSFFKAEKVDLVEVAKEIHQVFQEKASESRLYLEFEVSMEKCLVEGDRRKIAQVISNLLENAVKFTKKGGVTMRIAKKGKNAQLEVEDTGIGISEKSQEKLFKKFQQVGEDFYRHDSTQGVGLGLYISKMILDKMGGEIYLKSSKVGKGSIFSVALPLAR